MRRVQGRSATFAIAILMLAAVAVAGPSLDAGITVLDHSRLTPAGPVAEAASGPVCDGNNYTNDNYFDPAFMGGPMVAIDWVPVADALVTGIEIFSGEAAGPSQLGIWSDDGGSPSRPLASLDWTDPFQVETPLAWYGADLIGPVVVTAGVKYWIVWDPDGGEQVSATDDPADIQQTYWGANGGNVTGGVSSWNGPFSFPDRRWKFRIYCSSAGGDSDGDGVDDDEDLCPDTLVPESVPTIELLPNHWALVDGDEIFDTVEVGQGNGPRFSFTTSDTRGCSCEQVIEALGIGEGHRKHGCSSGVMQVWTRQQ